MSPRVSVVVPTHRRDGLSLLFRSLESQEFRDFEVVVADEVEGRELPATSVHAVRVESAHHDHFSPAHTYNAGLRAARGEVIVGVHDRSILPSDFLLRHVAYHVGHNDVTVGGVAIYFYASRNNVDRPDFRLFDESGAPRYSYRWDHRFCSQTRLSHFAANNFSCRASTITEALGGFDERLDDSPYLCDVFDADTFARLANACGQMIFDRNIVIFRADHKLNQKPPNGGRENYDALCGARERASRIAEIAESRRTTWREPAGVAP